MKEKIRMAVVFVGQEEFPMGQKVVLVLRLGEKRIVCETVALGPAGRVIKRVCGHLHRNDLRALECAERNFRK